MDLFTSYERGENARTCWFYDPEYDPEGSWVLETEAETQEAVEWERKRLESGELVALGIVREVRCGECGEWRHEDSCWGIVIEPDEAKLREYEAGCY